MDILHHTLSGNPKADICLVFIHGFACNEEDWYKQVNYFSKHYQILTCDLRGHGKSKRLNLPNQFDIISMAKDVTNLIHYLTIDKPLVLMGHSMGVRIVCELYAQISSLIAGLVLIDCGYQIVQNPDLNIIQQETFKNGFNSMMSTFFAQTFSKNTSAAIRETVMKNANAFSEKVGYELYPNIKIYDYYAIEKVLRLIAVPVLILQTTLKCSGKRYLIGAIDAKSEWLELVSQTVRKVTIKLVPECGHFLMLEASELTNTEIAKFLNSM